RSTSSAWRSCSARREWTWGLRRQRRRAMNRIISLALLCALGCASKKEEFVRTGDLSVALQLDPDPPRAGDNILRLHLVDSEGRSVEGARLGLVYDMQAMGAMPEMKGSGETR